MASAYHKKRGLCSISTATGRGLPPHGPQSVGSSLGRRSCKLAVKRLLRTGTFTAVPFEAIRWTPSCGGFSPCPRPHVSVPRGMARAPTLFLCTWPPASIPSHLGSLTATLPPVLKTRHPCFFFASLAPLLSLWAKWVPQSRKGSVELDPHRNYTGAMSYEHMLAGPVCES
jgi:hypothetical protein